MSPSERHYPITDLIVLFERGVWAKISRASDVEGHNFWDVEMSSARTAKSLIRHTSLEAAMDWAKAEALAAI